MLTVFVNKALLSDIKLDAPMFITFFQTVTSTAICFIMKSLSAYFPNKLSFPESAPFEKSTIKAVSKLLNIIFYYLILSMISLYFILRKVL